MGHVTHRDRERRGVKSMSDTEERRAEGGEKGGAGER